MGFIATDRNIKLPASDDLAATRTPFEVRPIPECSDEELYIRDGIFWTVSLQFARTLGRYVVIFIPFVFTRAV